MLPPSTIHMLRRRLLLAVLQLQQHDCAVVLAAPLTNGLVNQAVAGLLGIVPLLCRLPLRKVHGILRAEHS